MSQSTSVATPSYTERGKAQQHQQQQQQQQQHRHPFPQQQQQIQRYRDKSAATRADAESESAQQQRQRTRRPRSIHITLRKTRAGSRPVNIQRSQHPYFAGPGDRVGSPNTAAERTHRGGAAHSTDAYQLVDDDDVTPHRTSPPALQQGALPTVSVGSPGLSKEDAECLPSHVHGGRSSRAGSNSGANNNNNNNNNNNGGSSSSSLNGIGSGGCGSNASVGPSSGSGCAPLLQNVPQLNTFMKAPHSTLQQLLPPGMRDRINKGSADGAPATTADAVPPAHLHHNANGRASRVRSRSQLYINSSNVSPTTETTAAAAAGANRLRSNSSAGQYDGLAGSYSGVLGNFVFPYPDKSPAAQQQQQQLRTPPAAASIPTVNFDARSPRWSPPAAGSAGADSLASSELHLQQQQQQHYQQSQQRHPRSRSYTAGGHYGYHYHHRSSNTPVITASMAGAGGVAVFTAHTHTASTSHVESCASRNLDRSLSISSSPAGMPSALGTAGAATSTQAYPNVNTSRSSLRSVTTRETTPVSTATAAASQANLASATPPAQQQQQQQQRQQQSQRPTLTPSVAGTPVPLSRRSGSLATRRSASPDVVNGLDDSVDSVLCSSTPLRLSTHLLSGGAAAGTHRYVMDSMTSDSGPPLGSSCTPNAGDARRPRRYSMTLTDDDDGINGNGTSIAAPMSTVERLRARRDGNGWNNNTNNNNISNAFHRAVPASASGNVRRPDHVDASAEPRTAIERWRAQEEQKKRKEEEEAAVAVRTRHHRLSARQWREAFRRLEENRVRWTMRSFIGAGTSGKVYEGVLDDKAQTPVAVKVLDVGVPMPMGSGTSASAAGAGGEDGSNMSPAQQEALLVLLREVEMMERLHQENIVTCLRCQVTPVHDRFMELHHQQRLQQQKQRSSSQMRPSDSAVSDATSSAFLKVNASPPRAAAAPATRIPVQVEIIMELCKRGTLAGVVRRSPGGQLPVIAARRYLRDVLKGLAYLHRNNFIHRDVKGDNVLISADDVAKLADFGCSRRIVMTNSHIAGGEGLDGTMSSVATTHATDSRYTTMAEYQWCEATGVAQTMVGTPMFMAPEIIQASGAPPTSPSSIDSAERDDESGGEGTIRDHHARHKNNGSLVGSAPTGYTASADIWSFGCLVLEVFGRTPWPAAGNNVYRLMKQIEQSVDDLPPGVPRDAPSELLNLLRCCFHRDPHRRSTARVLLRSAWMTCKDEELEEVPLRRRR